MGNSLHTRFFLTLIVAISMLTGINSASGQVTLNNEASSFTITEDSFTGIIIENKFSSFNTFDVSTNQGTFTELSAEKYSYTQETGLPKLPVIRKLISIPVGASLEVRVKSSNVKEYRLSELGILNRLMPAQPPVAKNNTADLKLVIDQTAYNTNKFSGHTPASAEILGFLRGTRIARVEIAPIQYNPVTGIIKVYENMVVEVKFNGGDAEATQLLNQKTASPWFNRLGTMYANKLPELFTREYLTQYPVKMVIVSDPMFQEALQPYIQWKTRKGFHVIEAYTNDPLVGNTNNSIKNYLQNLYEGGTPEDPSPSFVLFVGDVAQIPAYQCSGHVSDLYYCEYTDDYFPEMYYGRFSATSLIQLEPQIEKTLMYEQYLFPDPSFLGECVMIAGMDGTFGPTHGNGQINYGTTYYFNMAHGLLSHTYLYPESGSSSSQIIQNVSDGVGFANYTAHGSSSGWADPAFSISDIPGLQNDGEYPLMVGNCCLTSTYNTNCFGEELLRASHKGAIGYIGGSNSTYWDEDFYFGVGVGAITPNPTYEGTTLGNYDRNFHDHGEPYADWYTTMDQIIFAGNLAVTEGSPSSALYYWEIYCLMGDPSLTAYMGIPQAMTVTFDPLMPLASTEFTVNSAPYAFVAISKNGVLHGTALADENGVAVVSLDPITVPGNAEIIVTAQNKQPYIGSVIVASPEGPYVIMQSETVNDEAGNNNLKIDYDEEFGFNITLKNVGNTEATNIVTTLTTTCPYLTIRNNTENWGTVAAGETVNKTLVFSLLSNTWLPDQFNASFELQITDGNETWMSSYNLKLNAPVLVTQSANIDDSQSLIPNGRIDPGETVLITIPVSNIGHSDAPQGTMYMFNDDPAVTLLENAFPIGVVASDSTMNTTFRATVADTTEIGTLLNFFVSANADQYSASKVYGLSAGLIIEDFETGDFTAFNWENGSAIPWTISSTVVNSGNFSAVSGDITDYGTTELQLNMLVMADGNISFSRKVSSESGYDYLKFYIDNIEMEAWSGEVSWDVVSYPVTEGNHTFKWSFTKDQSVSGGTDAGYIDDIIFPSINAGQSTDLTVHPFVYPVTPCNQTTFNLFAFTTNATADVSYQWEPSEALNNDTIYNPVASINETTEFTVTAISLFATDVKTLIVSVNPVPEAPVITQQNQYLMSNVAEGNQWYNSTGPIEGATAQSFEPLTTDYYHATIKLDGGCESQASNEIYYEVISVPTISTGADFSIYPNPFSDKFNTEFRLTKASQVSITLYNLLGDQVAVLYDSSLTSGTHNLSLQPKDLNPGVYFIKLDTGDSVKLRKIIVLK